MVIEHELVCRLNYGIETVMADVVIRQQNDCSLIATVTPRQSISLISSTANCLLESIPGSSSLLLKETPVKISNYNIPLEANLGVAELELQNLPQDRDIVSVKMYLTNIFDPYFYKNNIPIDINIPGQQKVVLSAYTEGKISHIAEVSQIPYSELENIKNLIDSICWLCSFASGYLSTIARTEVLWDGQLIYQELTSVDTTLNQQGRKVICDVDDLTKFIEHTYRYYKEFATPYNLNNLISLGILAKHTPYTQVKTLLMCNFLEVLRYNYALNIGCPNGYFTQRDDDFNWVNGAKAGSRAFFQEILEHFYTANSLTGWHSSFKHIRDQIVHTGNITGSTSLEKIQKYQNLHHFCDRVILALLQWDSVSGYYIPRNSPTNPNPEVIVEEDPNPEVIVEEEMIVNVNRIPFIR